MSDTNPEPTRETVRARYEHMSVRLADELDRLIKMLHWAREALEKEMFEGMGYKQLSVNEKDLRKLKDLTTTYSTAVEAKIRFDKAQKQMADSMTPAEEKAAVVAFLKSCAPQDRADVMMRVKRWQAENPGGKIVKGLDADSDS